MCSQWFITMINFVQHDGCEVDPSHRGVNFARNFTGSWFNFFTLNNGYHTIHHLKPGLHWSVLPAHHARTVKPHGGFRYGSVALDELLYMLPDDDGAAPITAGSPKLSPKMFAAGPPPFVDLRLAQ